MSGGRGAALCGLSAREWSSLTASAQKKIDAHLNKLKKGHDERIAQAERDLAEATGQLKGKLAESDAALKSVDEQLRSANSAADAHKLTIKGLESDCDELRKQRNAASDECHRLQAVILKQTNEIGSLRGDRDELAAGLRLAIESKCAALAAHDELQTRASSLEQRERRLEQEKVLLASRIRDLAADVDRYKAEHRAVRAEGDARAEALDAQLAERGAQLEAAARKIKELVDANERLVAERNSIRERLFSEVDDDEALDRYKRELDAKSRLIDKYCAMLDDYKKKEERAQAKFVEAKASESSLQRERDAFEAQNLLLRAEFEKTKCDGEKTIVELREQLAKITVRLEASKEESMKLLLEDMSPSAAAICDMMKSMSLTQIYGQIIQLTDDLSEVKKERDKLARTVVSLSDEIDEEKRKLEEANANRNALARSATDLKGENEKMSDDLEKALKERREMSFEMTSIKKDNEQLNDVIKNLGRQTCYLLQEIQTLKCESGEDSDKVSAKPLITFKSIEELQSNNVSLMKLVNELRDKLKYPKIPCESVPTADISSVLNEEITTLLLTQEHQTKMIDALTFQRDRFEKLYKESIKPQTSTDVSAVESEKVIVAPTENQDELENLKSVLKKQREDHKKYKEEIQISEGLLKRELENTRRKLSELSSEYAKNNSEHKTLIATYESLKGNVDTYKKQIAGLEERNKIYHESIVKQDECIKYLRDQTMESLTKLNSNEFILENLRQECKFLKDSENRLKKERDLLQKERFSQSLIMNNIELIKVTEEHKDYRERITLEGRLADVTKELSEVKRQLKLQETRQDEMKCCFEKQINQTESLLNESKALLEKKKVEIASLNDQLQTRTRTIDDLNKRVLNLLALSSQDDTPEIVRKVKDLENQLINSQSQIDTLQQHLSDSKEYGVEYYEKFVNLDVQYKELENSLTELRRNWEIKSQEMQNSEQILKDKISKLETRLSFQSRDLNLLDSNDLNVELSKTKVEALAFDLEEKNRQLHEAKSQILSLTQAAQNAENKYAHEMLLHSSDVKALSDLKKQLQELKNENQNLLTVKQTFENNISELKNQWKMREKKIIGDAEQMKFMVDDLRKQNIALHEQLQTFNTTSEDVGDSSNNLLGIIANLKKENEIIITKLEIVDAENERLKSEISILNKKLDDVKSISFQSQSKKIEPRTEHDSEILNKIEKLNTLTDSNVLLRQERDNLLNRVSQLAEASSNYESTIKTIESTNEELRSKFDVLQTENSNLKTEITRWRNRVGTLVEKANKTSPEDWKRLQNERESLVKMLTTEKENNKKLNEEIAVLKTAKATVEEQVKNLNVRFETLTDDSNKQSNELTVVKSDISRITQELLEAKTTLSQKEDVLAETTKREGQLRKIATKYKTQYTELLKTTEEQKSTSTNEPLSLDSNSEKLIRELNEKISQSDEKCKTLESEVASLQENMNAFDGVKQELHDSKSTIAQLTEANEKLKIELDDLKASVESSQKSNVEMETKLAEIRSRYDEQISQNERVHSAQESLKNSEISQLNRKLEYLMKKIKGGGATQTAQSPKPSTSFSQETPNVGEIAKVQALIATAMSDISSSPSSSQNVTENFPTSSSAQFHQIRVPPPESTQDVESNTTRDDESPKQSTPAASPRMDALFKGKEIAQSQQAASSSSNNSNSNSTVTTSDHDNSDASQRIGKRSRQSADRTEDESAGKRLKIRVTAESEVDFQVPTSSQREEDDCVVLIDSGDEDNQCGNSYQEALDMEEDDEEKIVPGPQIEHQNRDVLDKASTSAASENNEVDVEQSPNAPMQQQIETISSVTEGVSGAYDDGNDSIVPSTPVLYMPRRGEGFGEASNSPATESAPAREGGCFAFGEGSSSRSESNEGTMEDTHADLTPQIAPHQPPAPEEAKESSEADAENEDSSMVSSQGSRSSTPRLEEGSEAEASSTDPPSNSPRGNWRRGVGQRPQSDYQPRQSQRFRGGRARRRY